VGVCLPARTVANDVETGDVNGDDRPDMFIGG
jgi:hypothetical protein